MNYIEYVNKNSDPKRAYVKIKGIKFQGNYFRPCIGLYSWIRWGRYCIDLRPLFCYLNYPKFEVSEQYQESFETKFLPFVKKLPCDLFLMTVDDAIYHYEEKIGKTNSTNTPIENMIDWKENDYWDNISKSDEIMPF